MLTKKMKKNISTLTLALLLSGATFSSVSAKGNDVVKTNLEPNDIQLRVGGGPSDSAVWEKKSARYVNFSHDQLKELNRLYNTLVTSSSYNRGKNFYNAASVLAGMVGGSATSLAISGSVAFCENYWSLAQNAANTVNDAYLRGGTQALYVTQYHRPATGETMYSVSWY